MAGEAGPPPGDPQEQESGWLRSSEAAAVAGSGTAPLAAPARVPPPTATASGSAPPTAAASGGQSPSDPLALAGDWASPVPLLPLAEALDQSLLVSGLSREQLLRRLLEGLPAALQLPVLALLPRGWRGRPALLPERLRGLGALLAEDLLSPTLLAALADELAHLMPSPAGAEAQADPMALWRRDAVLWQGARLRLPDDLNSLLASLGATSEAAWPAAEGGRGGLPGPQTGSAATPVPGAGGSRPLPARLLQRISGPLQWHNQGLPYLQSEPARKANQLLAQSFNRLAGNLACSPEKDQDHGGAPWRFEGCSSGGALLERLRSQGLEVRARLRASVASFGLGASLPSPSGPALQVPIALPYRTGLLAVDGCEQQALLPHAALELDLAWTRGRFLLQYYQGTEGFCGWQGLNDLHRPWQNDRDNGTVRYLGEPIGVEQLELLLALTEVIALLHNREAMRLHLRLGGYGTIGFCLDSTALLQQAIQGRCDLFPVLLSGVWRQRLQRTATELARRPPPLWSPAHEQALSRYQRALGELPQDLSLQAPATAEAWRRVLACRPLASPFRLVQELPGRAQGAS